jgi:hypothetical protein
MTFAKSVLAPDMQDALPSLAPYHGGELRMECVFFPRGCLSQIVIAAPRYIDWSQPKDQILTLILADQDVRRVIAEHGWWEESGWWRCPLYHRG